MESIMESMHSSDLTNDDPEYIRNPCLTHIKNGYKLIQVNVIENGFYTILGNTSGKSMLISKYIYEHEFYPDVPFINLLSNMDNGCQGYHDPITVRMMNDTRYILVITTCFEFRSGNFSIQILGKNKVTFQPASKYDLYISQNQPYRKPSVFLLYN